MAQDIRSLEVVSRIISDIEATEVKQRRIREWELTQIYRGNGLQYTTDRVKKLYPESWQGMHISDLNILKKVIDLTAKAYSNGVTRELEDEKESETLTELYKDWGFNFSYDTFDKVFNRHKYSLLWMIPRKYSFGTKMDLNALNPWEFNVVKNQDTSEIEIVILNYPSTDITGVVTDSNPSRLNDGADQLVAESQSDSSASSRVYAFWTKDHHAVARVSDVSTVDGIKSQVDFVQIEDNPQMINPLGILPFIPLWAEDTVELPVLNDLGAFTIEFNALFSGLLTASAKQGFGQLIISRPQDFKIDVVHTGITTAMDLPQPPEDIGGAVTAEYINANPNLEGQLQTYSVYLSAKLKEYGITADAINVTGGAREFSSGVEREISRADISDVIRNNQQMYQVVEQKVYRVLQAYGEKNLLVFKGKQVKFHSEDLRVVFKRPKIDLSDEKVLANIEKLLDLGLIEDWEKFVVMDPNLTEVQAKKKLDAINKAKVDNVVKVTEALNGGRSKDNEDNQSEARQDRQVPPQRS